MNMANGDQDDAQNIQPSDSLIGMKKTEAFTQEICKIKHVTLVNS